jgi:hypothetical protein
MNTMFTQSRNTDSSLPVAKIVNSNNPNGAK